MLLEPKLTFLEERSESLFWSVSIKHGVTHWAIADLGDISTDMDSHFAQIKVDENFFCPASSVKPWSLDADRRIIQQLRWGPIIDGINN